MRRLVFAVTVCLALTGLAVQAVQAATGGPDAYGYTWRDHNDGCSQTRETFTAGRLTIPNTAAVQGPFDLGFVMPFYGQAVSQVWISPHGYITFSDEPIDPNQVDLPNAGSPRNMIAVAWRQTTDTATIILEAFPDEFHIQWVQRLGALSVEFEMWLFPSGGFRMRWNGSVFAERVAGYQDATGTQGVTLVHMTGADTFTTRDGNFPIMQDGNSACFFHPVLLDCATTLPVTCGETAMGVLPGDPAVSAAAFYSCSNSVYTGNEAIVELTVPAAGALSIQLNGPADADLMRVPNFCREDFCIEQANTGTDRIDYPIMFPGTYTFVVDKLSPGGGDAFSIDVTCVDPFTPISCGETVPGDTTGGASFREDYNCVGGAYGGPEQLFSFSNPTTQTITAELAGAAANQWVFIYDQAGFDGSQGNNCLTAGQGGARLLNAAPGDYVIMVDSQGPDGTAGAPFDLSLTCGDPFGSLACGDTDIPGSTAGGNNFLSTYSCSAVVLDGCEEMYRFSNPTLQTLSITLDTLDPDLYVLLFNEADFNASQGATCMAAGRGAVGAFNVPPGDYVIVVDGFNGACADYSITVFCGGQLDCDAAVDVSCTQVIAGDTTGSPSAASAYPCTPVLLDGGEDVYRFFNPVVQTITASFVSSQPGQRLMLLPSCDEGTCFLAGDQGVSCALFPPGEYFLVVDSPEGAEGPYELNIVCSEFVAGVDLRVTSIDASALAGECDDFDVAGIAEIALTNLGTAPANGPFDIALFEDDPMAVNGQYDPATDNVLGTVTYMGVLAAGETVFVDIDAMGTVLFRDNVIYAAVDTGDVVAEILEDNNLFDTGSACEFRPPIGAFTPAIEWFWNSSTVMSDFLSVDTVPLVGDVNADGTPDVVFNAGQATGGFNQGIVRVLDGRDGSEIWNAVDATTRTYASSNLALAELDGDPGLEIITQADNRTTLVMIDDDGSFVWESQVLTGMDTGAQGGGAVSIADIDCDGNAEIIWGHNVFNSADGTYFWTPEAGGTIGANANNDGCMSVAVDVDGDNVLEVVAGPTCYKYNPGTGVGEVLWTTAGIPDGHIAVGNFDADGAPEIALTSEGNVYLLEGDTGALIWQRQIPRGGGGCNVGGVIGGPPTVADFDGDCAAEVGVAGADLYTVLETDGTVRWSSPINDCSSHRTASSVFDFDGDGAAEVAFMDQTLLHIFSGLDGTEITNMETASHTWVEMISIADVDGDNNAEIIMPLNQGGFGGPGPLNGIQVIGDLDDNWVNTRRIWNQHQYHIGNVNPDGTIPGPTDGCEEPSWQIHNTFRDQIGEAIYSAPDITISILDVEVIPMPDCIPDLEIIARIGNGGAINVGSGFDASFYQDDGGLIPLLTEPIPDLAPGEFRDISIVIQLPAAGFVDLVAVADDDGTGMGDGNINECREDNNVCNVIVDASASGGAFGPPPASVGAALRVFNQDEVAPGGDLTYDMDWSLDFGAPRVDDTFRIKRGSRPDLLLLLAEDIVGTSYAESVPAVVPPIWYYKIVAVDRCGQEEVDNTP